MYLISTIFVVMMTRLQDFPSFEVLMKTFPFVEPYVNRRSLYLNKLQEFIMVLIKLRPNVPQQDIAYRFNVSRSVV